MTITFDHAHDVSLLARLFRPLRTRLAAFHHYWFVEGEGLAADPLASFSPKDWSDLPTWHPPSRDE